MKWWAIYTNLPVDVIQRLPHRRSGESQGHETFLAPSADNQTRNYHIECSNRHLSLSTLRPKGLSQSKIKWWATHTNIPVDVIVRIPYPRSGDSQDQERFLAPSADKLTTNHDIVRLPYPRSGDSQDQEKFLAPSADKITTNHDIECSNHHPSLSSLRPNGLSHSKMKWWPMHTNLPLDVIVKITHPRSRHSQNQGTSLAYSADKPTRNYDIECSNHHPSLSRLRPKGLSHSKMKWWAINTNLKVDVIVKLPHSRSGDSQNQGTSLAPSADKPILNYDIECSNHHPSLSTLRPKGFSRSKMKWWAMHTS